MPMPDPSKPIVIFLLGLAAIVGLQGVKMVAGRREQ